MAWVAWKKLTKPKNAGGLGFRDIEAFNDALLAKLSWRLIKEPNSLIARVLLGKYCHHTRFMDCPMASRPSHGWRGIMAGRNVIAQGLGFIVGNGQDISLWNDPWLSSVSPLRPMGPAPLHSANLSVADLINQSTNDWDWRLIDLHIPDYASFIKQIPLGSFREADRIAWLPVQRGGYTSRSGYALLTLVDLPKQQTQFNWQANIWKLRTLPKIKHFLWKAASGALAVSENLVQRGMLTSLVCKRCGGVETTLHVLRECPFATEVWSYAPISGLSLAGNSSIFEFLHDLKHNKLLPPSGITSASLHAWFCWGLWTARNQLVFSDKFYSVMEVVTKASVEALAWQGAQDMKPKRKSLPQKELFVEAVPKHIMYVDGAWNASTLNCGMGWTISSTEEGNSNIPTLQGSASRRSVSSALCAETWALRFGLSYALEMGCRDLLVRSDSQTLVTLLRSKDPFNQIQAILDDIRHLGCSFSKIVFEFTPCSDNVCADALAKKALAVLETVVNSSFI